MPVTNQRYALINNVDWIKSLSKRWPDAPLYDGHRMLVFAGSDLAPLESEFSDIEFKYLNATDTIKAMENNEQPPFILNLDDAREVCAYFTPAEEFTE